MNELERFAQGRATYRGKLAPHAQDIKTLREMGLTLKDIQDFLAMKQVTVSLAALSKFFIRSHATTEKAGSKTPSSTNTTSVQSEATKRQKPKKIFSNVNRGPRSEDQTTPAWLPDDMKHLEKNLY